MGGARSKELGAGSGEQKILAYRIAPRGAEKDFKQKLVYHFPNIRGENCAYLSAYGVLSPPTFERTLV